MKQPSFPATERPAAERNGQRVQRAVPGQQKGLVICASEGAAFPPLVLQLEFEQVEPPPCPSAAMASHFGQGGKANHSQEAPPAALGDSEGQLTVFPPKGMKLSSPRKGSLPLV